jgi:anti-anti-sigma factor
MNILKEKTGDYSILTIDGRIDTSNASAFEAEIDQLLNSGENNIILNCRGLNYISSSGLRVFLVAQKKTILKHGKLQICNLQPEIKEIFVISGFSTIFRIFDTQEEALEQ